jgi:hypothetical protein
VAAVAALIGALLEFAGVHKLGTPGVLIPVAVVAATIVVSRPVLAVGGVVVLTILCEGPTFGLFTFTEYLQATIYKNLSALDLLVLLAVAAVGLDVIRSRRPLWLPRPLALGLSMLALAMVAGVVTGYAAGASLRFAIISEHVLFYLLLLPLAVANLDLDRHDVVLALGGVTALAMLKAVLGLIEVLGHFGAPIEGTATLTYYESAPNWLIMITLLGVVAAALARARPPIWVVLGSPLLLACLVLSYRRSFWIGAVLGLLLVLLLGTSPVGRRMLVPSALALGVAIWALGSVGFQSQLPIIKRAESLSPSKLESNNEDRYRLDERANVLGEISAHPITGIGVTIPWAATVRPLSLEHEEGRQYVHFAALWFWLKLGVLGLMAYVMTLLGSMAMAWLAWRRSPEPLVRAFALASLCGMAGLIAIDTTASFTGVDARFTILFAAQVGLLALMVRTAPEPPLPTPSSG